MDLYPDLLEHRTFLAPMEGVGHPSFREMVARRGGIGMVCTEFVSVHQDVLKKKYFERNVVKVKGVPLSVQVMGNDEKMMAEAAAFVQDAGADVVDINLGCPSSHAAKRGVGAAMLKDLVLLSRVLRAMRKNVSVKLSAKIRAGFENERSLEIARVVEEAGCDFLVVHPRKRSDQYRGVADWRIIRDIKKTVSIPVVGNGDCWYACDAKRMREESGCDAVMIGRPAIRNPYIFAQIEALEKGHEPYAPNGQDFVAHLQLCIDVYRDVFKEDRIVIGRLKEQLRWMGRTIYDERDFRTKVLRTQTLDEMMEMAHKVVAPLSSDELDMRATPVNALERPGSIDAAFLSEHASLSN